VSTREKGGSGEIQGGKRDIVCFHGVHLQAKYETKKY
jgi:hypothetical protein